jgi:hypothetical protein
VDSAPRTVSLSSKRILPSLSRSSTLHETSLVLGNFQGKDSSNVTVTVIPTQNRVTLQTLNMWSPFKVLKQTFVVSYRAEQVHLSV